MTDFIAEVCSNHNGSLDRALTLIDTAAEIGCSGIKFQLFRLDKLYAPEVLNHPKYGFVRERRAWELPLNWLPILAGRCQHHGLKFGCTPFYVEAVDELLPYVDFFKVASYSLLHDELLVKVARTGKPVVLSTGMATMDEIAQAVGILQYRGCNDLTLLHCVSSYPAGPIHCHLGFIGTLKTYVSVDWANLKFMPVGWSDHSLNPGVIYAACLRWHASHVEFHLDLDGQGWEYGLGHCWLPDQIAPVIANVRDGNIAGAYKGKGIVVEEKERLWRADPFDGLRPLRELRDRMEDG